MEDYLSILEEAALAGDIALRDCKPTPVRFYSADLNGKALNEGSICNEGNCGGAYITGLGGNTAFVRWGKKNLPSDSRFSLSKGVYRGYTLSCSTPQYRGQSAERYEAKTRAIAKVLNDNGISCSVKTYLT